MTGLGRMPLFRRNPRTPFSDERCVTPVDVNSGIYSKAGDVGVNADGVRAIRVVHWLLEWVETFQRE